MQDIPTPYERLEALRDASGLGAADEAALDPYRDAFAARKHEFATFFYDTLQALPDTRRFLELERKRGRLRTNWSTFFGLLFTSRFDHEFLQFLWRSGLTHVEMSVDQRYINLGYILARRFCARLVDEVVPGGDRPAVLEAVTRRLDMCLLVATDAFLAATTQCDSEVMNGIAHQVRNPITVIGGLVSSLQRKEEADSPLCPIYNAMYDEARRLERMVADVGLFIDLFRQTPMVDPVDLEEAVRAAWDSLRPSGGPGVAGGPGGTDGARLELRLDPGHPRVLGDRDQLVTMFRQLLLNSLEALDPADPAVVVSSAVREEAHGFLTTEILNSGTPPGPESVDKLFTPFYSSKPMGTGFGLPIARLVARKVQGNVTLEPLPGRGTRVLVNIPVA